MNRRLTIVEHIFIIYISRNTNRYAIVNSFKFGLNRNYPYLKFIDCLFH